ncbi:MAG: hypothetical protein ACLQE9_21985, partial [Roseiarcus sp.]
DKRYRFGERIDSCSHFVPLATHSRWGNSKSIAAGQVRHNRPSSDSPQTGRPLTRTDHEHTMSFCSRKEAVMGRAAIGVAGDLAELAALAAFVTMIAFVARALGA